MNVFGESIKKIRGIGETRLKQFGKLGINNMYDVITYYPRMYEDRSFIKKISDLKEGDVCSFIGEVSTSISTIKARRLTIYKFRVVDDTGRSILVLFYNNLSDIIKYGDVR